jgi:type VI secretion system protein VasI
MRLFGLTAFLLLLAVPAHAQAINHSGNWRWSDTKDPLTDKRQVVAVVFDSLSATRSSPLYLQVACVNDDLRLSIGFEKYLDQPRVTTRIDSAAVETYPWRRAADQTTAIYPGDARVMVDRLLAAKRLVARVVPYQESSITVLFELDGMRTAVQPALDACPARARK